MSENVNTLANHVGEIMTWPNFGFAELVVGGIVALVLLAFALPAGRGRGDAEEPSSNLASPGRR